MRVAMVFAPYNHKKFEENITVVDEYFGMFPPVNLAYAAAIAERAGHEVIIVDANIHKHRIPERENMERTYELLKEFRPDILGFYMSTYMFQQTLGWAQYLKERLKVPVMVGGINTLLFPRETLTHEAIDYAVVGEAIKPLPALLKALEEGGDVSSIPGLCFRQGEEIVLNPPPDKFTPFDDYPFPARHLLPNEEYFSFISQRKNFTVMLTTVGCVYDCLFCPIAYIPFRYRSPESVGEEMEECYRKYRVREIDFFDADFPYLKSRLIAICEQMHSRGLKKLEWSCRARTDSLDDEVLREMARAGCRQIYIGLEAADDETLKAIQKRATVHQGAEAIRLTQKHGIRPLGFFIVGNPGETRESIMRTLKFAKSLKLDYVQFSRMIAKPRTGLDKILIERTGRDFWRDYVLGKTKDYRLPNPWTELSEEDIEKLTKQAYYLFYFRPWFVLKTLLRMKSWHEVKRSFNVGFRMLGSYFEQDVDGSEPYPVNLPCLEELPPSSGDTPAYSLPEYQVKKLRFPESIP